MHQEEKVVLSLRLFGGGSKVVCVARLAEACDCFTRVEHCHSPSADSAVVQATSLGWVQH